MQSIVSSKDRLHFFEYLEVDLMQEYLRNGIHYFINAILNGYPQLIKFRYYSNEIAAIIDFLKDFYYLLKHNSTYAEHFFSLERKIKPVSKLNALKGALIWTILPYLITKIDNAYNTIVGEEIDGKQLSTWQKIIRSIYPYIYTIISIVQTIYKFRYLYIHNQQETYYHLYYQMNGLHLGHRQQTEQAKYPILELFKKPGILIILMGHKILTWYFNKKNTRNVQGNSEKVQVAAPINDDKVDEGGICPICTKITKNPTMVRTTGYVYCFDCINSYVKRQHKCPMSQIPINETNLQILYD